MIGRRALAATTELEKGLPQFRRRGRKRKSRAKMYCQDITPSPCLLCVLALASMIGIVVVSLTLVKILWGRRVHPLQPQISFNASSCPHAWEDSAPRKIPCNLHFNHRNNLLSKIPHDREGQRLRRNVQHTIQVMGLECQVFFFDNVQCRNALAEYDQLILNSQMVKQHSLVRFNKGEDSSMTQLFDQEPDGRLKSDMCRLAMLYLHGGYYFDTDIVLLEDVRKFLHPSTTFSTIMQATRHFNPLGFFQAFVAAQRNSPIIAQALECSRKWYADVAQRNRREIERVTFGHEKPNVGTVMLRDAYLLWSGNAPVNSFSRHRDGEQSQFFFEDDIRYLPSDYRVGYEPGGAMEILNQNRFIPHEQCRFIAYERCRRRIAFVSRVAAHGYPCLFHVWP